MVEVDNPSQLPAPQRIDHIEEPYVRVDVMVPKDFVGAVMELSQDKRGVFIDMQYMTKTRVTITYDIPLAEIVFDYFDLLKTRTKATRRWTTR